MKLKSHLALSTVATSSAIVIVVTTVIFFLLQNIYQKGLEERGIELGRVLSQDHEIINAVEQSNRNITPDLEQYIEHLRAKTAASYIVVVNKHAIRLSHPNHERLGKTFIGDDIYRALNTGEYYSTVARGSLGNAIRNFVPLKNNGEVIGAICIGYLSEKAFAILLEQYGHIGLMIAIVYIIAIAMMTLLVFKMKRTFLNYEPELIVHKFSENELILNSIRDAIIAVDNEQRISTINDSALQQLSLDNTSRQEFLSQTLARFSPTLSHLVLEAKQRFYQGDFTIGKLTYRANIYPLQNAKGALGHVVVFFANLNQSELERELVYLKNYSELLRSKTHEHANKLNTLSGMLQLGKNTDAIRFIQQESDHYQAVIQTIVRSVHNSFVAGLLLAKFNKATDMGIKFSIDQDTFLCNYAKTVSDKLVTIIGNLVDNALLAAWKNRSQRPAEIQIYLSDRNQHVIIEVQDSGIGINEAIADRILEFGVSSKQGDEQHGVGLYLVGQLIESLEGTIDWERTEQHTTLFSVYLNKNNLEQYD
ncbi:GHKL domain-containing protein [Vibrio sp. CAIM 722]|uniref:GHKL domain-containing protein n=1 Tax=Vibrio eleionomae TaxID=2653505 RepID=A0A7X4RVQ1_9VIBR|nr:sensor histidine kinase [Vibrio eleionomae]MZI94525.1 GHKL domain-containing protein [Vibrio eleionomae]